MNVCIASYSETEAYTGNARKSPSPSSIASTSTCITFFIDATTCQELPDVSALILIVIEQGRYYTSFNDEEIKVQKV